MNLPSGLRIKRNNLMLDFRHEGIRYRIVTKLRAKIENLTKVRKLLTSIRFDVEKNNCI